MVGIGGMVMHSYFQGACHDIEGPNAFSQGPMVCVMERETTMIVRMDGPMICVWI